MIVWINGACGVGKTSVAKRLVRRLPGARLFDPERIGFELRHEGRLRSGADFQDLPEWRRLTVERIAATEAASAAPLVVPMALADPGYFDEVIGGLRSLGLDLRHFTLTASAATVERRLRERLDWPSSRCWALARVEPCVAALAAPRFAEHVDSEAKGPADLADHIAARLGG